MSAGQWLILVLQLVPWTLLVLFCKAIAGWVGRHPDAGFPGPGGLLRDWREHLKPLRCRLGEHELDWNVITSSSGAIVERRCVHPGCDQVLDSLLLPASWIEQNYAAEPQSGQSQFDQSRN